MPLDDEQVKRLLAGKTRATPYVGRFVGIEGTLAVVDLGDQRITIPFLSAAIPPEINESVNVWSLDGAMFVMGSPVPKPGIGVVSTISTDGKRANVETEYGVISIPFGAGDPPTSGDTVGISWPGPWGVKLSTSPDPVVPPPNPGGGSEPQVRTLEFRAIDAGSTKRDRVEWWTPQPYAGNTSFGAWFYGDQIKDTIPAGAQLEYVDGVPQIFFHVSRQQDLGGMPRFTLHSDRRRGGIPAMSGFWEWDPAGGYQVPPEPQGWFDALKAGGDRAGIGLNQGGNNIFKSLAQDGMSGALKITWRA